MAEVSTEVKQSVLDEKVCTCIAPKFDFNLPKQKLKFIRDKGDVILDDSGKIIRVELDEAEKNGQTPPAQRARGHRKGVLMAFLDPDDEEKVCIGYSVCHKNDRFDYRKGNHIPGLGIFYALNKAKKHRDTTLYIVSTRKEDRQVSKSFIKIPQSIVSDLQAFIHVCNSYYKDRKLPEWAIDFADLAE
jgi:hypothetical protein